METSHKVLRNSTCSVAHSKAQSLCFCLSFWDTDFISTETLYKLKRRRSCRSIQCFNSKSSKKKNPKRFLCVFVDVLSITVKVMLADSHHVPRHCLAWIARGTRWHFQHKHTIMYRAPPVCSLLAQPVSQSTGTELWWQFGFSCAFLQGHNPDSQIEPVLHAHTDHIICHFTKHADKYCSFVCFLICQPNIDRCTDLAKLCCPFCQM